MRIFFVCVVVPSSERPTDDLLDRKPYGRNKALVSRRMWWFVIMHAIYQVSVLFFVQYGLYSILGIPNGKDYPHDPTQHYTMVFNTFVLCQLFNEINARKLHGEWNVFSVCFIVYLFLCVYIFNLYTVW